MLDVERLKQMESMEDFTGEKTDVKALIEKCRIEGNGVVGGDEWQPQVPYEEIFPAAMDIIETLEDFDLWTWPWPFPSAQFCFTFFSGSERRTALLKELGEKLGQKVLFIACNEEYEWLVGEDGKIYSYIGFGLDKGLRLFSQNIYEFLEKDICDEKHRGRLIDPLDDEDD